MVKGDDNRDNSLFTASEGTKWTEALNSSSLLHPIVAPRQKKSSQKGALASTEQFSLAYGFLFFTRLTKSSESNGVIALMLFGGAPEIHPVRARSHKNVEHADLKHSALLVTEI